MLHFLKLGGILTVLAVLASISYSISILLSAFFWLLFFAFLGLIIFAYALLYVKHIRNVEHFANCSCVACGVKFGEAFARKTLSTSIKPPTNLGQGDTDAVLGYLKGDSDSEITPEDIDAAFGLLRFPCPRCSEDHSYHPGEMKLLHLSVGKKSDDGPIEISI